MEICSNNHDVIVYDIRRGECPLCEAQSKIYNLLKTIDGLEEEVLRLEERLKKGK